MDARIQGFLANHQVGSLSTLLANGRPHAAAIHFSYSSNPLEFYFLTKDTSRKVEGLKNAALVPASVAIGFSDEELVTLQLDGDIAVAPANDIDTIRLIHFAKNPEAKKYLDDPAFIFLKFTPRWWRFTDYNTRPTTIFSSEEQVAEAAR